eukprot:scaffold59473_cov24-Tisochrysis_lutea.AAC.3
MRQLCRAFGVRELLQQDEDCSSRRGSWCLQPVGDAQGIAVQSFGDAGGCNRRGSWCQAMQRPVCTLCVLPHVFEKQVQTAKFPGMCVVCADAFRQSSAGPAALDAASELCKPVDVLPAEAALYQVEEVEEECGVCMESMASL